MRTIILILLTAVATIAMPVELTRTTDFDGHTVVLQKSGGDYQMLFANEYNQTKLVRFSREDWEIFRIIYKRAKKSTSALANGEHGEVAGPLLIDECLFEFGGTYPKDTTSKWLILMIESPAGESWEYCLPVRWWGEDAAKHRKSKAEFDSLLRKARF